jgi:hypothetical protein
MLFSKVGDPNDILRSPSASGYQVSQPLCIDSRFLCMLAAEA